MNWPTEMRTPKSVFGLENRAKSLKPRDFQMLTQASDAAMDLFKVYLELLCRWQKKINLVSAATLADPWRRHFFDSAQLYPLLTKDARIIVDIGSGAGFPALVLAILDACQDIPKNKGGRQFHLIESNKRKSVFLREIIRLADIPVVLHGLRAENYNGPRADVVTARACAPLKSLLALSAPFLAQGGQGLFLKGAKYRDELTPAQKDWKMLLTQHASKTNPDSVILQVESFVRTDCA